MAAKPMHDCEAVDIRTYFDTAPLSIATSVDIGAPAAAAFAALEDEACWPRWAPAITKVTWTSPRPFSVGTTRTVDMRGGMIAEELFTAWETGRRMAFIFTRANMPADAFAEEYTVVPRGEDGCTVTWRLGMTPGGGAGNPKIVAPILRLSCRWMLRRFAKLVEKRAR